MTTRVTEGARRERHNAYFIGLAMRAVSLFSSRAAAIVLASRGFAAQRSRARALPLLNLKQKRDCSKSRIDDFSPACKNRESCKVD